MMIETTRFGQVEVDEHRIITFNKGLLGFERHKRFVMIEAGEDSYFWWLQSLESPDLAFVVTDPGQFVPTYRAPIGDDLLDALGCESIDHVQVLVIVNKCERMLTGNLQGPLVINVHQKIGQQLVLSEKQYTPQVPLLELSQPMAASA